MAPICLVYYKMSVRVLKKVIGLPRQMWVAASFAALSVALCPLPPRVVLRSSPPRQCTERTALALATPPRVFIPQHPAASRLRLQAAAADDTPAAAAVARAAGAAAAGAAATPPPGGIGVRTLGVDFGLRRTGLAISSGFAPIPLRVLAVAGDSPACFGEVAKEVTRAAFGEGADQIVLGMPYNSTGGEGEQAFAHEP